MHFPVFTLKLPEPSTDSVRTRFRINLLLSPFEKEMFIERRIMERHLLGG